MSKYLHFTSPSGTPIDVQNFYNRSVGVRALLDSLRKIVWVNGTAAAVAFGGEKHYSLWFPPLNNRPVMRRLTAKYASVRL